MKDLPLITASITISIKSSGISNRRLSSLLEQSLPESLQDYLAGNSPSPTLEAIQSLARAGLLQFQVITQVSLPEETLDSSRS